MISADNTFAESDAAPSAADTQAGKRSDSPAPAHVLIIAFQSGKSADGGIESLTQLVERYTNLKVTLLTQVESSKTARWKMAGRGVHVWPLPYKPGKRPSGGLGGRCLQIWAHLKWNLAVARLVLRLHVDVVHINDPHALWHTAGGLALLGIPVVYNIRDTKPSLSRRDVLKWRCAFLLTRTQIVLSREMAEFWKNALGIAGRRLVPIYSVVDFTKMRPLESSARQSARVDLGLPKGFSVGYVASFSEKKAQLKFIERAGPELKRRAPAVSIHFLGDFEPASDPYAASCERAAHALALQPQLAFRGFTDHVEKWYPAFDAVVVATQNEGLARCMIESLACGTPVVSFSVCSAREILEEGGGGVVVEQGNYTGLISALSELAVDRERCASHGRSGIAHARRKFAAQANVAKYQAVYQTLIERPAAIL